MKHCGECGEPLEQDAVGVIRHLSWYGGVIPDWFDSRYCVASSTNGRPDSGYDDHLLALECNDPSCLDDEIIQFLIREE